MNNIDLPEDCAKQWEILLLLISSEEKKIDRTTDNEIDTMCYFFKNEGVRRILQGWLQQMELTYARKISESDTALKSDEISLLWRQQGNDKFRANLFADSLDCYTRSVKYACQGGLMYPLALANRSAALLKLKKFEDCMADVKLAIAEGYPLEQQHKLILRRADCHIEMGALSDAKAAIAAAIQHASTLSLTSAQSHEFEKNIKILQQKLEVATELPKEPDDIIPDCYKGLNDDFVNSSSVTKLVRNDDAGRHVIVTEAVKRGDVMFSEEPYAWVALPHEPSVCEGCCRGEMIPVPCKECSRSLYCSVECRDRAYDAYHRWECAGTRAELFTTIGIAHLALRVLFVSTNTGFPKVEIPEGEPQPTTAEELFKYYSAVDSIDIYNKDTPAFFRMFNLVTNFGKMNNSDYIQYALTAYMLTLYLERCTTFFEYMPTKLPYELSTHQMRLFTSCLLLRSLGQLVCNGHATLGLCALQEEDCNHTMTEREVRRATAIYPSAAMMNHSCDANIINTFYKNRLIIRCNRELSEGSELTNCYGPHRAREPTPDRRAQLRAQYMFTCKCTACTDPERGNFVEANDPPDRLLLGDNSSPRTPTTWKKSQLLFSAYCCPSCKGPVLKTGRKPRCTQCMIDFNVQKAKAIIDRADEYLAQAKRSPIGEEKCEKVQTALRLKQQVLHRHHTALRVITDILARTYAELGEYNKSVEMIKHNIQSLEYQFGSFSVEVAHELRKLSDVMLERILRCPQNPDYGEWCLEAHKIIKKSVQLMEFNYGSWEMLVKRLREQESLVAALVADSQSHDLSDSVHRSLHYNLKI